MRKNRTIKQFRKNKKGQAAMEFLMTYGWAMLALTAAIGALAYFGVLNPSKFIPEVCQFSTTTGMACIDFNVDTDSAHLLIENAGGRKIHLYNITMNDCSGDFNIDMNDGERRLFNITGCSFGKKGKKMKSDITITYQLAEGTLVKSTKGKVVAKIA